MKNNSDIAKYSIITAQLLLVIPAAYASPSSFPDYNSSIPSSDHRFIINTGTQPGSTYRPLTTTMITTPPASPRPRRAPNSTMQTGDYNAYLLEQQAKINPNTGDRNWRSQYATSKIEIDVDKKLETKSGELDLLIPFFYQELGRNTSTWFVQPGAVFNDSDYYGGRDFVHVGVGYRSRDANSFLAFNTFYDYDITRAHHRGNIGTEYARQFFKISANYYFPLSERKESVDQFNIDGTNTALSERATYGADMNFSGHLPQLPYLSVEAKYQKFWAGEKVGVSNGNEPTKNPFIFTSTVNFQPLPLFTVKAGYSHEQDGKVGLLLGTYLTYRFGVPLQKQMERSELATANSLDVKFLNLVERDNNIRLEYEKLRTPPQINR